MFNKTSCWRDNRGPDVLDTLPRRLTIIADRLRDLFYFFDRVFRHTSPNKALAPIAVDAPKKRR